MVPRNRSAVPFGGRTSQILSEFPLNGIAGLKGFSELLILHDPPEIHSSVR